ncbi:MAG TPA: ferritin-like domain-containing protein [Planctomycetota bacterium]|nr:ferritin-like domain-containing protein [Planctomycetota bacterium]
MNGQNDQEITRQRLVELLNEDLSREYQAIIAYTIFSQVIKGAQYMTIARELEEHAKEELDHARKLAKQLDYFGVRPTSKPQPVPELDSAEDMLRFDLQAENETIGHYRTRIRQAEALGEFGLARDLREIIRDEQDHQIELATALGMDVPKEGLGDESGYIPGHSPTMSAT